MPTIDMIFCAELLRSVMREVKEFDYTIMPRQAETYIEQYNNDGKKRWFTFKFRNFYYENYVDNFYDGKAQAWSAYLEKMKEPK